MVGMGEIMRMSKVKGEKKKEETGREENKGLNGDFFPSICIFKNFLNQENLELDWVKKSFEVSYKKRNVFWIYGLHAILDIGD